MTEPKTQEYWQQFAARHKALADALCDTLTKHGVNANDGEAVMFWLIGLSVGARGANPDFEPMAAGYVIGQARQPAAANLN